MIKISGVVITFNEEKNIARCIESMVDVVDEIVVLDSFSTDSTPAICQQYGVCFHQQKFEGYGAQKRGAVALCHHDYILSLDADEELSTELRDELMALKRQTDVNPAFSLNRRNYVAGHFVRFCGWNPDWHLRFFNRKVVNWNDNLVHETVDLPQGVQPVRLKACLFHYTFDNYGQLWATNMKYGRMAAEQRRRNGKGQNVLLAAFKAVFRFVKTFVLKLGFLDGVCGLVIACTNAKYAFLKYKG